MDTNNIKEDSERLVKRFISLDPVDFDSAINEFFEPDATVDNFLLKVKGASKLKKLTALQALVADGNELVGKPSYDDQNQVVNFEFKRTFKYPPILPSLPILSSFFAGQKNWYPCQAQFHLKQLAIQEGEGEEVKGAKRLFVSKVGITEPPQPPLVNFVLYHFLRPLFSIVAVTISFFASFYYRHIKDTWFQFFFAAINEFFQGVWSILLSEKSKGSTQAQQWRQAKGEDLRKMIEQAKSTARKTQTKVESRAKKAGVPVDEVKKEAEPTVNKAREEVVGSADYFGAKKEEAKKQVKESKSASSSGTNSPKSDKKSSGKSKTKSSSKTDGEKSSSNTKSSKDKSKKSSVKADVPQTPLGGHDPTASNAPSFAKAAELNASSANGNGSSGTNDDAGIMDDVPQTPLGGHDPTASNAPSYAQATNE